MFHPHLSGQWLDSQTGADVYLGHVPFDRPSSGGSVDSLWQENGPVKSLLEDQNPPEWYKSYIYEYIVHMGWISLMVPDEHYQP